MAEPYDVALRQRAVAAYHAGEGGYHDVADMCRIGWRTLQRWVSKARRTGSVAPDPKRGGWRSPIDLAVLEAVIAEAPDSTLAELCWAYNRRVPRDRVTTPTSVGRAMRRAGYVLKRNGRGRASAIGRTSRRRGRRS